MVWFCRSVGKGWNFKAWYLQHLLAMWKQMKLDLLPHTLHINQLPVEGKTRRHLQNNIEEYFMTSKQGRCCKQHIKSTVDKEKIHKFNHIEIKNLCLSPQSKWKDKLKTRINVQYYSGKRIRIQTILKHPKQIRKTWPVW